MWLFKRRARLPDDVLAHTITLVTACVTAPERPTSWTVVLSWVCLHRQHRRPPMATTRRRTQDAIKAACMSLFMAAQVHASS